MNLELTYSEMSFLREIVQQKKLSIWKSIVKCLHNYKELSIDEINERYERYFESHNTPISDEGCIVSLLKKFDELESEARILLMKEK